MKQKLLVLCGGQSSEHIVSRMSCTSVLNNLDANKYEITLVGIDLDGGWHYLDAKQTDLAKNTWLDNSSMVEDVYGLSLKDLFLLQTGRYSSNVENLIH